MAFSSLLFGLIALFAVIAIGSALAAGRPYLAALVAALVAVGIPLAHWIRRLRKSLHEPPRSDKPRRTGSA